MRKAHLIYMVGLLLLCACGKKEAKERADELPSIFPDYVGVTVPETIAPLNFMIEGAGHIRATVRSFGRESIQITSSGKEHVEFDMDKWHNMLESADSLRVTVSLWDDWHPEGITFRDFTIYVSHDSIDPWIAYRLIPPGYEGWNKMGIYQRELSSFDEQTVVDNTDNGRGCLNCHAACNGDPENFMFHSRGGSGGTIIKRGDNVYKVNLKNLEPGLQGSYNAWHPSARYIAFSSNTTVQAFMARSRDKIEGYDVSGKLFIYDVEQNKVHWDERFTNDSTLESFPSFSPDGNWLYFVSAKPVDMPLEYDKLRYNILRVPFNQETAELGAVDTVWSAYEHKASALTPRISEDGRYLMYSTSRSGYMHLYHNDADLGMMDLSTGDLIDCSMLNSNQSESYHGWSRNGHWIVFSSKREDGRFTRVFFAHWNGKTWTKPFMLPQQDPRQNTLNMFAYNIPDFMIRPIRISRDKLRELIAPHKD